MTAPARRSGGESTEKSDRLHEPGGDHPGDDAREPGTPPERLVDPGRQQDEPGGKQKPDGEDDAMQGGHGPILAARRPIR